MLCKQAMSPWITREPRDLQLLFLPWAKRNEEAAVRVEINSHWYKTVIKGQLLSSLPFAEWENWGSDKWSAWPGCSQMINCRAGPQTPGCKRNHCTNLPLQPAKLFCPNCRLTYKPFVIWFPLWLFSKFRICWPAKKEYLATSDHYIYPYKLTNGHLLN